MLHLHICRIGNKHQSVTWRGIQQIYPPSISKFPLSYKILEFFLLEMLFYISPPKKSLLNANALQSKRTLKLLLVTGTMYYNVLACHLTRPGGTREDRRKETLLTQMCQELHQKFTVFLPCTTLSPSHFIMKITHLTLYICCCELIEPFLSILFLMVKLYFVSYKEME